MTTARWTALCLTVAIVCGCNDGKPERVPVSGVVLVDGNPLTQGTITVYPTGARPSLGKIGADGHFELMSYKPGDGVVLGTHAVSISAEELVGEEKIKWHAPKKYANPRTSGLSITVTESRDDVKIELTTKR